MAEPHRKSLLHVLLDQMKLLDRNVYVHRLIYCGKLVDGNEKSKITSAFGKSVKIVNDQYHDEILTGFLLLYPNYFIHIVESSEESIASHLNFLLNHSTYWERMKVLVIYHHVNQRLFREWSHEYAIPPTSLDTIQPTSDINENFDIVQAVIKDMYNLAKQLEKPMDNNALFQNSKTEFETNDFGAIYVQIYDKKAIIQRNLQHLPSTCKLDFILSSPFVENLESFAKKFGTAFETESLDRSIWPISVDFVPFNVFEVEQDPIQDLPYESKLPTRIFSHILECPAVSSQDIFSPEQSLFDKM